MGLLSIALVAGALSGLVETGTSHLLLPVLMPMFGAVEAILIIAVVGFMANFSRPIACPLHSPTFASQNL